jgi:hypothetical protein
MEDGMCFYGNNKPRPHYQLVTTSIQRHIMEGLEADFPILASAVFDVSRLQP